MRKELDIQMEEQNKAPQQAEHPSQKNHHRSRRHHSHHRGEKRPVNQQSAEANETAPAKNPAEQKGADTQGAAKGNQNNRPHNHKKHRGGNNQNHQKNEHSANEKSQSKNDKKRKNGHGGSYVAKGPVDLYGNPTADDVLTMEELRAKIVLKSADGSVPAKETPATETEEPIAPLPDDLLFPGDEAVKPARSGEDCVEVVGVRFRSTGKVYFFDPKGNKVRRGNYVIVETARGPEFGEINFGNRMVSKTATVSPLRPVLRVATEADIAHNEENRRKEEEALEICRQKVKAHKLDMKILDVQYAFDNSKLLFYFTSEGRVDFRDLVKDLAAVFRTRIELRQIGIRDEAKMLGGLGACGRTLCCSTFLSDFVQVSIKMAKEQGLSLNSAKISGVCGRLMCCLRYEADTYAEALRQMPAHDALVKTPDGIGNVMSVNPLARTVRVIFKNSETPPKQFSADEITVLPRDKKGAEGLKNEENKEQSKEE